MKMPNNYGSVTKLSGKRRNPYMVRLPEDKQTGERKVLGFYHTKTEAMEALATYHETPLVFKSDLTVDDVWNMIKDEVKVSDSRKVVYKRVYDNYFEPIRNIKVKEIRAAHLQHIIDNCEYRYSTKSNIRSVMNQIFDYAVINDIAKQSFVRYLKFEQEEAMIQRRIYTSEEIKKIWEHKGIKEYDLTLFLLHQGMRIKEALDMTKDWIDLDAKTIDIKIAKNKQSIRTIPINNTVYSILEEYYNKSEDEHIFHLKKTQFDYFVRTMLDHTPYDVRHTFASKANELNLKTVVIQRIMGHKPDTILEDIYVHLKMDELSEAINQVIY